MIEEVIADLLVRRIAQELLKGARIARRIVVIDEGVAMVGPHIGLGLRCQRPFGAQVGR
jgi:hypothetical protein